MSRSKKSKGIYGMGSIRQRTRTRKDGSKWTYWEGRISRGFNPVTGKRNTVTVTGNTQKETREKLQEIAVKMNDGSYRPAGKVKLTDWFDVWLKEYQVSNKPLTIKNHTGMINKHILPALGSVELRKLNNLTIQRFYNSLSAGDHPLSPKTVKNIHSILHKALEQAVRAGELARNPADNCVLPRQIKKEIKPLEPEEITQFIQCLDDEPYRNLFLTAFFTGMRQGELLGLSWDRVDFKTGIIEIRQQLQCIDGKYYLETPKHDKVRYIAPARIVMDILCEEKVKQEKNQEMLGEAWKNEWNLVFTDELGKCLVRRTVDKHFKKVLKKSGIEEHRFHDLRHTFAVSMLDAGEDLKSLQENLGHATAAFTLNQYAHVSKKMRMQTSQRMHEYFTKLMPAASM